jgi:hypothetical protein
MAIHPSLFHPPEEGNSSQLVPPPHPPKGGLKNVDLQIFKIIE